MEKVYKAGVFQEAFRTADGEGIAAFDLVGRCGNFAYRRRWNICCSGARRQIIEVLGWHPRFYSSRNTLMVAVTPVPCGADIVRRKIADRFGVGPDAVVVL